MPSAGTPARTLLEVAAVMDLRPLEPGDWRYVDIAPGRRSAALRHLRVRLEDAAAAVDAVGFVKLALTGHRGCGKSTELLRLEHDLRGSFTSLHLYADEQVLGDYDYTYLFLWLVDQLVRHFEERLRLPLREKLVADVVQWFADVGQLNPDRLAFYRDLFRDLLYSGTVLEYDGGENWYDVHPVIQQIDAFCEALGHEKT